MCLYDPHFSSSQPYCSLHLHLKVSENPYTSGIIASRDTAPSIIVASGKKLAWFACYCKVRYFKKLAICAWNLMSKLKIFLKDTKTIDPEASMLQNPAQI